MQPTGPDIAWVDTIDVCHLRCPTCIRGLRGMPNTSRKMDLELFVLILRRLREQGYRRIGLFNWTEPFLNHDIEKFVAEGKAAGFWVSLSSTLSLPRIPNLEASLLAGLDLLTVSVSGFDQETYEINHVGGVWEYVTANLHRLREIMDGRRLTTHVDLRLLRFPHNAHQEPLLRAFAAELGFHFELVEGVGNPEAASQEVATNEAFLRELEHPPGWKSPEDEGKACELMFNQVSIDCAGDAYLCCITPNYPALRLGPFLEMSAGEILAKKYTHATCRGCTMPRRERSEWEQARLDQALAGAVHAH